MSGDGILVRRATAAGAAGGRDALGGAGRLVLIAGLFSYAATISRLPLPGVLYRRVAMSLPRLRFICYALWAAAIFTCHTIPQAALSRLLPKGLPAAFATPPLLLPLIMPIPQDGIGKIMGGWAVLGAGGHHACS